MSGTGSLIFGVASVAVPLARGGREGTDQVLRTADSVLTSSILTEVLKRTVRQRRPRSQERDSFPSGHATASFAVASMASHFRPKQAPYWYLGAVLISASRVQKRAHYVHDVLAGAAIGYGITRLELSRPRGLILSPIIRPRDTGAGRSSYGLQVSKMF